MNRLEYKHTFKISTILSTRMLGLFMLFPVFSVYAKQYQASPQMIGVVLGIYGLTQALLQLPFGYLSDKYGRKPLLIIGLLLFLVGSIIAALADDAIGLVIGRALQGMGAISSVLMASLADVVRPQNRIKANAVLGMQIGAAFLIALIIAPSISYYFALSGLFWFITLLAAIALLLTLNLDTNYQVQTNISTHQISDIFKVNLLRLDLSIFCLHFIFSASFVVLPLMLYQDSTLALVNSWQFYLPVLLASFMLMLPLVIIAYKYQKIQSILYLSTLGLVAVEFGLYFFSTNFFFLAALIMLFFTFFNVIEASLPTMVANIAPTNAKGIAMGVFNSTQFLGIFCGGLAGGLVYGYWGIASIFLLGGSVAFLWLIGLLITARG